MIKLVLITTWLDIIFVVVFSADHHIDNLVKFKKIWTSTNNSVNQITNKGAWSKTSQFAKVEGIN